jgi:preprotein translocase subunit SecD
MNKYPAWKYVLIAVALLVSIIYASPNLFGEVPVVQVSGARASVKVEEPMRGELEAAIKGAGIALAGVDAREGQATSASPTPTRRSRRATSSSQGAPGYVVALNLQRRPRRAGSRPSGRSPCTSAWTCAAACISCCRWT